jgi:AcrR family transcriptional regulator
MMKTTRSDIIDAAEALFYENGLRSVSVDAIAARAGVTKRTLYYHFESKDELIAAYLAARDAPTVERYRSWLGDADRPLPDRITRLFAALASFARQPKWRGCGFTRAAVELAGQPGHPAVVMAADHKKRIEGWLAEELRSGGVPEPALAARQVMILLEGAIAQMLIHRDVAYSQAAGQAAAVIVATALSGAPVAVDRAAADRGAAARVAPRVA